MLAHPGPLYASFYIDTLTSEKAYLSLSIFIVASLINVPQYLAYGHVQFKIDLFLFYLTGLGIIGQDLFLL